MLPTPLNMRGLQYPHSLIQDIKRHRAIPLP